MCIFTRPRRLTRNPGLNSSLSYIFGSSWPAYQAQSSSTSSLVHAENSATENRVEIPTYRFVGPYTPQNFKLQNIPTLNFPSPATRNSEGKAWHELSQSQQFSSPSRLSVGVTKERNNLGTRPASSRSSCSYPTSQTEASRVSHNQLTVSGVTRPIHLGFIRI